MKTLEWLFESTLWQSRLFILVAVVFSLVGGIVLFLVGGFDIYHMVTYVLDTIISGAHPESFHEKIVGDIIGSVDLFLMGVVMLIFSFGLYELFISEIDAIDSSKSSKIFEIHSLDQLKDKLAKVIVMVLVVSFFKRVIHTQYNGALELLYFSGSILALCLGLYFLHKNQKH